jgi:hypothetical protein
MPVWNVQSIERRPSVTLEGWSTREVSWDCRGLNDDGEFVWRTNLSIRGFSPANAHSITRRRVKGHSAIRRQREAHPALAIELVVGSRAA